VPVRTRWIIAGGLAVVGLVWIGQGTGLLAGSGFMVGDPRWAAAGIVLLAGSVLAAWTALKARRQA
jgi:hypothetical protein